MKTTAAVLHEQNQPLEIEDISIPGLKAGQVLVNVTSSGVCHTQLNEIDGRKGPDKYLPHVLGHEGAGIVEEIGTGVTKVKPGDHVVLTWIKGRGMDVPSAQYASHGHIINSGAVATFLKRAVVSENRLVPISKDIPFTVAALLGCAIPTGAGVVFNTIEPELESTLAVFGVGGIGMSAVMAAKAAGCARIIAVDIHEFKLRASEKLGATDVLNATGEKDVVSVLKDLTGGRGVDYAIEATGCVQVMENAFSSVRDDGGLLVIAGNSTQGDRISIDPFDLIKGKRIIGTWGGATYPDTDIPKYADLYLQGKLELDKMISHRYKLGDVNLAVETLRNCGEVLRVVLEC